MVRPVQPEKKITKVAAVHKIEREKDRKKYQIRFGDFLSQALAPNPELLGAREQKNERKN